LSKLNLQKTLEAFADILAVSRRSTRFNNSDFGKKKNLKSGNRVKILLLLFFEDWQNKASFNRNKYEMFCTLVRKKKNIFFVVMPTFYNLEKTVKNGKFASCM